jgi:hypothetical protein
MNEYPRTNRVSGIVFFGRRIERLPSLLSPHDYLFPSLKLAGIKLEAPSRNMTGDRKNRAGIIPRPAFLGASPWGSSLAKEKQNRNLALECVCVPLALGGGGNGDGDRRF